MILLQKNKALARALVAAGFTCALMANSPAMAANKKDKQAAQTAEAARIEELAKQVEALVAQNKALQDKVQKLEVAQTQQSSAVQQQAATVQQQGIQVQQQAQAVEKVQQEVSAANAHASEAAATVVSSYGEIGYSHPTKSAKDTSVDIQRAVIGMQHRFDDKTKMVSEFEWEHAITSASDKGEAEVEQLWIEREFQPDLRGRVGLFLMPVGLLNKNHEPTAYYGVFRPDVDTKIIPSTWREVGLGLSGDLTNGLNWDVALTTAPNLSKWDPTTTEGRDRGPLQAIHGEGQYAAARDLGVVGALNWQGVPGLLVGGSVVYDSIGQHQPNFPGNDSKLLLWDVHTRYQIAGWDLAAEYARGTISHTEALNTSFIAGTTPNPTLVPHLFYGGYVQAAYKLWQSGDYTLLPFARYELLNTAADFGSLAGGVKSPDEHIWTTGANLRIGDGVVLKADYRNYSQNKLPDAVNHFNLGNSFNLGAGFSF
ncbi:MAG: hypothetical protein JO142_04195 [Burkholderiales bacterium]|nr:hypothetical protein [Burkholderiales bacterium]